MYHTFTKRYLTTASKTYLFSFTILATSFSSLLLSTNFKYHSLQPNRIKQMTEKIDLSNIQNTNLGCFPFNEGHAYLAKAKDVFPHVDQLANNDSKPTWNGTPDELIAKHNSDDFKLQMKNKVKKCPNCGKPVAFTLPNCNGCGRDLSDVDISYTNNVFMGFAYGIEKGPFPFKISLRYQDDDMIVIDDLLALAPLHLNSIVTSKYIADWRFLFTRPAEGKKIIEALYNNCWKVVETQFWANEEFRKKNFKNSDSLTLEQLKKHIVAGFNFPPSQYQLHLQFMLPPFTPFHQNIYHKGGHFTYKRFFPYEYIIKICELGEKLDFKDDTPIDDIIAHYKTKGIDYDEIHSACYKRYNESHEALANYSLNDFEAIFVGDDMYKIEGNEATKAEGDEAGVQKDDKLVLQNYGRPYSAPNKPSGQYYTKAKQFPGGVEIWRNE